MARLIVKEVMFLDISIEQSWKFNNAAKVFENEFR
jgi:hypothetical protein